MGAEEMEQFLKEIEATFHQRFNETNRLEQYWKTISGYFPPSMDTMEKAKPHQVLAGDCGDLGLAILWIVQTILVQQLVKLCRAGGSSDPSLPPQSFTPSMIGALAASEPGDDPMIMRRSSDGAITLSGTKKYITGGLTADMILVTARQDEKAKIDTLIALPADHLAEGHIHGIDMESLNTIDHGRMVLSGLEIDESMIMSCSDRELRKTILVQSTIERDLIMEAYIAFMQYLNRKFREITGSEPVEKMLLKELLKEQETTTHHHIEAADTGERLEKGVTDFNTLFSVSRKIQEQGNASIDSLPDELKTRLLDLKFFLSMGKENK